uniref:AB hydrolase-1 domain-containing protein n=1 Tax=Timema poppense TaxID=170557 RepID=A0A7R9DPK0_TIMPO|nr:unnamed protein product [Timema poppensis]
MPPTDPRRGATGGTSYQGLRATYWPMLVLTFGSATTEGTPTPTKHISLDTDSADYWDFSWHENGFYDLPAMIDHIRSQTGQDKIYYIGHSMGTTGFYVMGSMRPEYNDKIRAMFSLAPIAYMSHMTSPFLQLISQYITELQVQLLQSSCTLEESMFT